jgi:hypothetical protein
MSFNKAVKQEAKLRLAIAGPSGSGKTFTALTIAEHLTDKPVALVDTEHGSASKYADLFSFDVMEMHPPFSPERFVKAISEAQAAGYGAIILDSLSHAWNGTGGLLEIVDDIAARSNSKNTFAAWKQGTPIYNKLIDGIIQSDIHIIATMRSKQDYVLEPDERGKMTPKKVGMAPIQRDGFEYEFDIVLTMDSDNTGVVTKTRCSALQNGLFRKPGADIAAVIRGWLTGAAPTPKQPAPASLAALEAHNAETPAIIADADRPGFITPALCVELGLSENEFSAVNMLKGLGIGQKTTASAALPFIRKYRAAKDGGKSSKEAYVIALNNQ